MALLEKIIALNAAGIAVNFPLTDDAGRVMVQLEKLNGTMRYRAHAEHSIRMLQSTRIGAEKAIEIIIDELSVEMQKHS